MDEEGLWDYAVILHLVMIGTVLTLLLLALIVVDG